MCHHWICIWYLLNFFFLFTSFIIFQIQIINILHSFLARDRESCKAFHINRIGFWYHIHENSLKIFYFYANYFILFTIYLINYYINFYNVYYWQFASCCLLDRYRKKKCNPFTIMSYILIYLWNVNIGKSITNFR